MGLQLTLTKENNHLYHTFENAYWNIGDITYNTTYCSFTLRCYPSRESYLKTNLRISQTLLIGGPVEASYRPILYSWTVSFPIEVIFPNGIPLDANMQKTGIYNYLKTYTALPFTDVYEE